MNRNGVEPANAHKPAKPSHKTTTSAAKSTKSTSAQPTPAQLTRTSSLGAHRKVLPSVAPSPLFALFTKNTTLATYVNQFISWDTSVCIHLNRYSANQNIATFFKIISRLGDGWFWYLMLVTAFVLQGSSAIVPLIAILLVGLLGLVLYKLLKAKTVRPRPYQVHQVIVLGERPLDVFSFPSGHTLQAVLFTSAIGVYVPQLLPIMLIFTCFVALSRMILGLHYPTDVLVGAGIGYALSLWVTDIERLIRLLV